MGPQTIKISPILNKVTSGQCEKEYYTLCWIQNGVSHIEINKAKYRNVSNSVFFLTPDFDWKIYKNETSSSSGYLLSLPKFVLDYPAFKNLHITQVRLFKSIDEIPKINLSPGIEKRVQSILEMLDELTSTNLAHKEDAILSLLNTFFVYCDGKCNIKTYISENSQKAVLVYKFKKIIDKKISEFHEVSSYAELLCISDKYLNECVKEVLGTNAKSLIDEKLIMTARHELKFIDKTIKEIAFQLGFSSPDYFSYFLKKHTKSTPSQVRKN
ncbi:helix-turn-helix domain-containing protein [uncultured Cyclobacterium sp.]|uniref:helix-turn-helix domain-containing protein n=1 Tax=uncultured Cyclobacterium sp. TaxID=453820 RepID=UPI0030EF2404|tara:strand:+ start:6218 stop:7027 length:810 start_codon:yes stop_codon:yes gene_type:complete